MKSLFNESTSWTKYSKNLNDKQLYFEPIDAYKESKTSANLPVNEFFESHNPKFEVMAEQWAYKDAMSVNDQ